MSFSSTSRVTGPRYTLTTSVHLPGILWTALYVSPVFQSRRETSSCFSGGGAIFDFGATGFVKQPGEP